jgi:hypothetical protein
MEMSKRGFRGAAAAAAAARDKLQTAFSPKKANIHNAHNTNEPARFFACQKLSSGHNQPARDVIYLSAFCALTRCKFRRFCGQNAARHVSDEPQSTGPFSRTKNFNCHAPLSAGFRLVKLNLGRF